MDGEKTIMINILDELKKIKMYIDENYEVDSEIKKAYIHEYSLIIKIKKYDIKINVSNKNPKSYIPDNFGLRLGYEANKKYRSELYYAGGGYMTKYFPGEYSEIDSYLKHFGVLKTERQTTIFDFIER